MLIPIGHDKGFYRRPWLTAGIILLSGLAYAVSTYFMPNEKRLAALEVQEREAISRAWKAHGDEWIAAHRPDLRSWPRYKLRDVPINYEAVRVAFMADFVAGRVVPRDHQSYRQWLEFKDLEQSRLAALSLAYRAGDRSYTLVSYAFLHGGFLHLFGNMLFLLLCGCNLEDRWGRLGFGWLYLSGAAVAALSYGYHHGWNPDHAAIGASGAVAAVMGAFLVTHYDARLRLLYVYWYGHLFIGTFSIRAFIALPLWLAEQVAMVSFEGSLLQVGYSAHVGGFLYGAAFALLLRLTGVDGRLAPRSEAEATTVLEPEQYLAGLAHLESGDQMRAKRCFEQLLAAHPHHANGALELYRMALEEGDRDAIAATAATAIANLKRSDDHGTLRRIWSEIRLLSPPPRLDDRALITVARSFAQHEPREGRALYSLFAEQHPDSPMRGRALLDLARLHMELHERDDARRVLVDLVAEYPQTAYAERAEALLDEWGLKA